MVYKMTMEEALAMRARQRIKEREAMGYGGGRKRRSKFKWTPQNRLKLVEIVEAQGSYKIACEKLGIEKDRFENFLEKNVMFKLELERRIELFSDKNQTNKN